MAPSRAWINFRKVDNGTKVECNLCHTKLKYCNNTSNMMAHLKALHKNDVFGSTSNALSSSSGFRERAVEEAGRWLSSLICLGLGGFEFELEGLELDVHILHPEIWGKHKGPEDLSFSDIDADVNIVTPAPRIIGPLDRCLNNLNSFALEGVRTKECMDALLYMICVDCMPLSTPERKGFKLFCKTLQPLFSVPCEKTITKKIQEKYFRLREIVGRKLAEAESLVLTTDLWTHKNTMRSYLGVTVHYREGVEIKSVELGARLMEERKTADNLKVALRDMCADWKIKPSQIRSVVTDGGANIKKAIKEEFGADKHVSCFAHQLNIIGEKAVGLHTTDTDSSDPLPTNSRNRQREEPERESDEDESESEEEMECSVRALIVKVKRIVRFFRQSEIATSKLLSMQKNELKKTEGQCLKLIQEVRTRWNSCFDMIARYLVLCDFVTRVLLEIQREKTTKSKPPPILNAEEEEALKEVNNLLSPLARATREISYDKQVTLSKCIPLVRNIRKEIQKCTPSTSVGLGLQKSLEEQLKKYFGRIEEVPLYAIATLLDPRFKKFGFSQDDIRSPVHISRAITHVSELIIQANKEKQSEQEERDDLVAKRRREDKTDDFWGSFDDEVKAQSRILSGQDVAGGIPVEFRTYLDSAPVDRVSNPNPLRTWEALKNQFPSIYPIAVLYLSQIATSVPSERLFSHAGLIATLLRNRLSGKHLEMLVFLRSCDEDLWFNENLIPEGH